MAWFRTPLRDRARNGAITRLPLMMKVTSIVYKPLSEILGSAPAPVTINKGPKFKNPGRCDNL